MFPRTSLSPGANPHEATQRLQSQVLTTALDLDWYQSPEGQGVLAHLVDPNTGCRKLYGLLEQPNVPPTIRTLSYKLYLCGKSGAGKTSLVYYLCGRADWASPPQGETPGIRATKTYWPARIRNQVVLFELDFWDSGEASSKKYSHVAPVCKLGAAAALLVFSFTDKGSFDKVAASLASVSHPNSGVFPVVVGTKYGLIDESQVTQTDVVSLESKWNVSVLRIRYQNRSQLGSNDSALVLNMICDRLFANGDQKHQES